MSEYIVLTATGVDQIELPNPKLYSSEIHMALSITQNPYTGEPITFDHGYLNDYRTCHAEFLLTALDRINVHNWLKNVAAGRCNTFGLSCEYSTGFHVFGPDCGHSEDYTVNELRNDGSGRLHRPFNRYNFEMDLLMVTNSGVPLPVGRTTQGEFVIGSIDRLPYPQVKPLYTPGWRTGISNGGDPVCLDTGIAAAYHTAEITIDVNRKNAAHLVNHLVVSVRNNLFNITTPTNCPIFGVENGDVTFRCKLQSPVIKADRTAVDRFKITLQVWMKDKIS
jgi:hypothetical protein